MKVIRYILTIITTLAMTLSSTCCDNKWPKNGDFDGMWQLMSIEQNGTVTSLKDSKHYWSVRANLVQFSTYHDAEKKVFCHFQRTEGKLILTDFCHESLNEQSSDNDEWISYDECDILEPWGLYPEKDSSNAERVTQTFTIELLNSDNMILSTPTYKLQFRKF